MRHLDDTLRRLLMPLRRYFDFALWLCHCFDFSAAAFTVSPPPSLCLRRADFDAFHAFLY